VPEFEPLREGEFELDPADGELIWRQVHPNFIVNGEVTRQAFGPSSGDAGQMSVDRSSIVTAEEAHQFFTAVAKRQSAGSWAVSTTEVQESGSRTVSDVERSRLSDAPPMSPGHAYIDFRSLDRSGQRIASSALLLAAIERGRQHPPVA
jgi:hypothetical protein